MNIVSCLHPVRVRNPYTNEIMHVPCRKCVACRNAKQAEMVNRLQYESMQWPYKVFFTLTYAPEYCPKYTLTHDGSEIEFNVCERVESFNHGINFSDWFLDDGSEQVIKFSELPLEVRQDEATCKVLDRAFSSDCEFRVVDKRHVQLFIKRLRFHLQKFYNNAQLRYFVASEYGCDKTENYRPHYHGLLFTDSQAFAKDAYKVLCDCWKLGFVGCDYPRGNAAAYVAKYINCLASYPKIYESFLARPFALYSKKPAIGLPKDTDSTVREIVLGGTMELYMFVKTEVKSIPFWRSLESRYFPKCREFDKISHSDRVRRYTPIARYAKYSKEFLHEMSLFLSDEEVRDDYIAQRVAKLAYTFDKSLDWYVHRIEDYYVTKRLLSLSKFYDYQCTVADNGKDISQLVNLYPEAVKEFHDWWTFHVKPSLPVLSFGLNPDEVDTYLFKKFSPYFRLDSLDDWTQFDFSKFVLKNSSEYQDFKASQQKRHDDSLKTKRLNASRNLLG